MAEAPAGGVEIDPNIVTGRTCPFMSATIATPIGQRGNQLVMPPPASCVRSCQLYVEEVDACSFRVLVDVPEALRGLAATVNGLATRLALSPTKENAAPSAS